MGVCALRHNMFNRGIVGVVVNTPHAIATAMLLFGQQNVFYNFPSVVVARRHTQAEPVIQFSAAFLTIPTLGLCPRKIRVDDGIGLNVMVFNYCLHNHLQTKFFDETNVMRILVTYPLGNNVGFLGIAFLPKQIQVS